MCYHQSSKSAVKRKVKVKKKNIPAWRLPPVW